MKKLPSIALGTWSWRTGFAGGDQWHTRSITLKKRGTNYQDEKSNNI